jgi:hypothetical protein
MPWSADIGAARSPLIHQLHAYWQARAGGRPMPRRADIDPAALKPLLANLVLVDLERDPLRVRYRLVGTTIVRYAKFDCTGLYRDEFAPAIDEDFHRIYRAVAESGRPICGSDLLHLEGGGKRPYEFAIFPLSCDGVRVDKCVGLDDYESLGAIDPHRALPDLRLRRLPAA